MSAAYLLQLGLTGLLVALLPLSMVWASRDADKYRKLAWVTLFLTLDLVMFGAFTRLTDSGLGCPDWPGCYGHANPFQAHAHISAAEAAMPGGPVTVFKAWTEMVHRYLAMAVGVLIISLTVLAWWRWLKMVGIRLVPWIPPLLFLGVYYLLGTTGVGVLIVLLLVIGGRLWLKFPRMESRLSPWLPTFLLGFVCLQGAFGAWTVTLKLQPVIVTLHLLFGMVLLGLLVWLAARHARHVPVEPQARSLRLPAALALVVLTVQIALGGWVSTNYAALACTDFPLCHGLWLPEMDFANGFTLWRHLGKTADGGYLAFPALTAIHWMHRLFAIMAVAVVAWVAHKALRIPGLQKTARWLLIMLAVQFLIGVSTVFLRWPLELAVAHNGGAALLVILLTMLNYKTRLAAKVAGKSSADARRPPYEFIT